MSDVRRPVFSSELWVLAIILLQCVSMQTPKKSPISKMSYRRRVYSMLLSFQHLASYSDSGPCSAFQFSDTWLRPQSARVLSPYCLKLETANCKTLHRFKTTKINSTQAYKIELQYRSALIKSISFSTEPSRQWPAQTIQAISLPRITRVDFSPLLLP